MQLLAERGFEKGEFEGLGLISGEVEILKSTTPKGRIPHIGWNEVKKIKEDELFKDIDSNQDFYFVHSYHFIPKNKEDILAKTPYCGEFVSAIKKKNIYGVQFHPEKSSSNGFKLLKNFLKV